MTDALSSSPVDGQHCLLIDICCYPTDKTRRGVGEAAPPGRARTSSPYMMSQIRYSRCFERAARSNTISALPACQCPSRLFIGLGRQPKVKEIHVYQIPWQHLTKPFSEVMDILPRQAYMVKVGLRYVLPHIRAPRAQIQAPTKLSSHGNMFIMSSSSIVVKLMTRKDEKPLLALQRVDVVLILSRSQDVALLVGGSGHLHVDPPGHCACFAIVEPVHSLVVPEQWPRFVCRFATVALKRSLCHHMSPATVSPFEMEVLRYLYGGCLNLSIRNRFQVHMYC